MASISEIFQGFSWKLAEKLLIVDEIKKIQYQFDSGETEKDVIFFRLVFAEKDNLFSDFPSEKKRCMLSFD